MYMTAFLLCLLATSHPTLSIPTSKTSSSPKEKDTSLHATLSQMNSTHCHLKLTNTGPSDLNILKWNSLFDPSAESHSFTIRSTSTNHTLPHGPEMLRKTYDHRSISADDILHLAAKSSWTGTYDLSRLFDIPTTAEETYTVSFSGALTVLSSRTHPSMQNSHRKVATCAPTIMHLKGPARSAALNERFLWFDLSDRARIHSCDNAQIWVLSTALAQARTLAEQARDAVPTAGNTKGIQDLYTKYFNDNSQTFVANAFDQVSKYSLTANPGIGLTFYCNTDAAHSNACDATPSLIGYAPAVGAAKYVTLCNKWFTDLWSQALCAQPGTQTPPPGTWAAMWQEPIMQPGILLHEMLHSSLITHGISTIIDGPDPNAQGGINYVYSGVTALAANAATNHDAPLTNSENFVLFAMAVANQVMGDKAVCNCCPLGGMGTLDLCGLDANKGSKACGTCSCGGADPNP